MAATTKAQLQTNQQLQNNHIPGQPASTTLPAATQLHLKPQLITQQSSMSFGQTRNNTFLQNQLSGGMPNMVDKQSRNSAMQYSSSAAQVTPSNMPWIDISSKSPQGTAYDDMVQTPSPVKKAPDGLIFMGNAHLMPPAAGGRKSSAKSKKRKIMTLQAVSKKPSQNEVSEYHQQLQNIAAAITNIDGGNNQEKGQVRINYQVGLKPRKSSAQSQSNSKRYSLKPINNLTAQSPEFPQSPEAVVAVFQSRNFSPQKKSTGGEYASTQPPTFYGPKYETLQSMGSIQAHMRKHQQRLQNQRIKRKLLGNAQVLNYQNSSKDDSKMNHDSVDGDGGQLDTKYRESQLVGSDQKPNSQSPPDVPKRLLNATGITQSVSPFQNRQNQTPIQQSRSPTLDNPMETQVYHLESMVSLLQKLEKNVEKASFTKGTLGKPKSIGTLVFGSGPQKQENKTWIPLKESLIIQQTSPEQLNNTKDIAEKRFPKLHEAIQREKVSIGKALDGSRFKKVQKLNKTPQNQKIVKGDLELTPEEGGTTPHQVDRVIQQNEYPSSRTRKQNPSLNKYQPSKLVIDIMSNYFGPSPLVQTQMPSSVKNQFHGQTKKLTTTGSLALIKEKDKPNSGYKITRKTYKNVSETSSTQKKIRPESVMGLEEALQQDTNTKATPLFSQELLSSQIIKSLDINSFSNFGSIIQVTPATQHLASSVSHINFEDTSQLNPTASFNTFSGKHDQTVNQTQPSLFKKSIKTPAAASVQVQNLEGSSPSLNKSDSKEQSPQLMMVHSKEGRSESPPLRQIQYAYEEKRENSGYFQQAKQSNDQIFQSKKNSVQAYDMHPSVTNLPAPITIINQAPQQQTQKFSQVMGQMLDRNSIGQTSTKQQSVLAMPFGGPQVISLNANPQQKSTPVLLKATQEYQKVQADLLEDQGTLISALPQQRRVRPIPPQGADNHLRKNESTNSLKFMRNNREGAARGLKSRAYQSGQINKSTSALKPQKKSTFSPQLHYQTKNELEYRGQNIKVLNLEQMQDFQSTDIAPPSSPKQATASRLMLKNRKFANKTPEPQGSIDCGSTEDVYNFIKRERASQKDLINSSQANHKLQDYHPQSRSKSNSVNHSQELPRKQQTYIEAVKQEIQLMSQEIRGGSCGSQLNVSQHNNIPSKSDVTLVEGQPGNKPVYYNFGQQKVLSNMLPITSSGKYVTSKFPGRIMESPEKRVRVPQIYKQGNQQSQSSSAVLRKPIQPAIKENDQKQQPLELTSKKIFRSPSPIKYLRGEGNGTQSSTTLHGCGLSSLKKEQSSSNLDLANSLQTPLKPRTIVEVSSPDRSTINSDQGIRSKLLSSLNKAKTRALLAAARVVGTNTQQTSSNNLIATQSRQGQRPKIMKQDSPSPRPAIARTAASTVNVTGQDTMKKSFSKSLVKGASEAPLPPVERVRPALFVMLEKQLQEAKEGKPKPPPVITLTESIKRMIKIWHREDLRLKALHHESRIQRAIDISNTLFRLANKSQLPPHSLQNIQAQTFFTKHDLACLKRANVQIPKNKDLSGFLRSRDFYGQAREAGFVLLTAELQQSVNYPGSKPLAEIGMGGVPGFYSKFFVGYGNNFPLVKQVLKNRWWLANGDQCTFEECPLIWTSWKKQKILNKLPTYDDYIISHAPYSRERLPGIHKIQVKKLYGRMEDNFHLANKKGLLMNLKEYYRLKGKCVFEARVMPKTFLIRSNDYYGQDDLRDLKQYLSDNPDAFWIVKPGEDSNRGAGITLCENGTQVMNMIRQVIRTNQDTLERNCADLDSSRSGGEKVVSQQGNTRTLIVQSYIKNPLLINKRKFDIRVYGMLVTHYGTMRGYFYEDGYLRTSCKEFTLENFTNKYIHLTNDAIQKYAEDYGRFESGNKLSYADFQKYLDSPDFVDKQKYHMHGGIKFMRDILPQIRHLVAESFRSVAYKRVDPNRRVNSFEIFGFDFMIDDEFTVYLIEANTNPCLEINGCSVLARIIPHMLECAFRIAVDPILPPPDWAFKKALEPVQENKMSLIYDDEVELMSLTQMYERDASQLKRQAMAAAELREEEARMELINNGGGNGDAGCGATGCNPEDDEDAGEDMYENTDEGEGAGDHGN